MKTYGVFRREVIYIGPLSPTSGVPVSSSEQKPLYFQKPKAQSSYEDSIKFTRPHAIIPRRVVASPLTFLLSCPDPLQDFFVADLSSFISINGFPCKPASNVTSDDFFFDGLSKVGNTSNIFGSNVIGADILTFPGLNTLGISMNRVVFAPGGVNPPHTHPRATESGLVIEGKLLVGFVTTGNVYYSKVLTDGQMFVIPKGFIHFQKNVGVGKALAITAFTSHSPAVVALPFTLFASTPSIPDDIFTRAFQVEENVVESIKSKFSA